MKHFLTTLLITFSCLTVRGQSITPDVVSSAGDFKTSPAGSLSWTLGEIMTETFQAGNGFLSQGAQQSGAPANLPKVYVSNPANGAVNLNVKLNVSTPALAGATTYTIELCTDPNFSGTVISMTGLKTQLFQGLAFNTLYFARVKTNLSSTYGKITSFSTAPSEFFAYVTSPATQSINVRIPTSVTANPVIGANLYTIELNTAVDFSGTSFTNTGARTFQFKGLKYGQKYYTRVKTELSGNWGPVGRYFTTLSAIDGSYVTSPANNALNVPWQLNVTSTNVGASNYTIQLSPDINFQNNVLENSGPTNVLPFSGLQFNTLYYARVSPDPLSGWGPLRSFTTAGPASLSYIISPKQNATNTSWVLNLTAYNVPGASTYTIEVNTSDTFLPESGQTKTGGRSISFSLSPDHTYFVRVMTELALSADDWGPTRTFSTGNAVSLAYLLTPKNGGTGVPNNVKVTANAVPGATRYTIELNPDQNFSPGSAWVQTSTSRAIQFNGLASSTLYYARVSTNAAPGAWGTTSTFTTVNPLAREAADWMGEDGEDLPVLNGIFVISATPNPFTDRMTVELQADEQQPAEVSVHDISGRVVRTFRTMTNRIESFGEEFSPGMYLVRISVGNEQRVLKVVKVK